MDASSGKNVNINKLSSSICYLAFRSFVFVRLANKSHALIYLIRLTSYKRYNRRHTHTHTHTLEQMHSHTLTNWLADMPRDWLAQPQALLCFAFLDIFPARHVCSCVLRIGANCAWKCNFCFGKLHTAQKKGAKIGRHLIRSENRTHVACFTDFCG